MDLTNAHAALPNYLVTINTMLTRLQTHEKVCEMALLDPVRELLPDAEHWCQRTSRVIEPDGTERQCVGYALCLLIAKDTKNRDSWWAIANELVRENGHDCITDFNDTPERTFEEIQEFIDELEASLDG